MDMKFDETLLADELGEDGRSFEGSGGREMVSPRLIKAL
eukprot:gene32741-39581_t